MLKWLILRGSRFYDVLGILVLTLSVDSLSRGISRLKHVEGCILYVFASILFLLAGSLCLKIVQTLKVDEEMKSLDEEEFYKRITDYQHHIVLKKRILASLLYIFISICSLVIANILSPALNGHIE